MGKRLTQLTRVTEVDKEDYLLVDGQNFLESKKVALKDINLNKFNTEDFYNKSQVDGSFVKQDGDKGLSTNDFTNEDKQKLDESQEKLISGVNLKTINGQSLLGKGDIDTEGGSGGGNDVGQKTLSGGEIFNDYENNKALSEFSTAIGRNNTSGTKAFQIQSFANNTFVLDSIEGLNIGDVVSVKCQQSYINVGSITKIDTKNTAITISVYDAVAVSALEEKDYQGKDSDERALFVILKPELGTFSFDKAQYAEGAENKATLYGAHAEGYANIAADRYAHAEGTNNIAYYCAHAEGKETKALGMVSHAEGRNTQTIGDYSHAEGHYSLTKGAATHAEGYKTEAHADCSHAEGTSTKARGLYSHVEGQENETNGIASHSEGKQNFANGNCSHAEGLQNTASAHSRRACKPRRWWVIKIIS